MIFKHNLDFTEQEVEKVFPEGSPFKAMKIGYLPGTRGITLEDVCTDPKYVAQQKIDGSWYNLNITENHNYLFGRTVSKKNGLPTEKSANVPHIIAAFANVPKGTSIVGEIWTGHISDTAKDVTHFMGSLPAKCVRLQEEAGKLNYFVHDVVAYAGEDLTDKPYSERYKYVQKLAEIVHSDFVQFAENLKGNNKFEVFEEIVAAGGEGIVLKNLDWKYEFGKRPAYSAIKIKKEATIDAVCMGFEPASIDYNGEYSDSWQFWRDAGGKFYQGYKKDIGIDGLTPVTRAAFYGWNMAMNVGLYKDGALCGIGTVSSGFNDKLREDSAQNPEKYIGKVVELSAMEILDSALRHPVLIRFRDDKDAQECQWSEVFKK